VRFASQVSNALTNVVINVQHFLLGVTGIQVGIMQHATAQQTTCNMQQRSVMQDETAQHSSLSKACGGLRNTSVRCGCDWNRRWPKEFAMRFKCKRSSLMTTESATAGTCVQLARGSGNPSGA
jgi:hypothetical protein